MRERNRQKDRGVEIGRRMYRATNNSLVGDDCSKSSNKLAVLQKFSTQVERDVLGVDDTLHEPQPLGNNLASMF
jgi:hypothetical protein